MKRIATIVWVIIAILAKTLVFQFGWNEIVISIIDVNRISFLQAFGLNVLLTYIVSNQKTGKEDYEEEFLVIAFRGIVSAMIYASLLLLTSLFI